MAEARRAAGVAVALYVVDIDGSQLIRLAGSEDFPETLEAPPALGPEIVPEGLPSFYEPLRRRLPRCVAEPLWLRGRVIGLLLCVGAPVAPLEDIAKQGAAALELANDYTDVIEAARRRKPTTAAAEVQHNLLPPRIARITGAQLAGALLPDLRGRRRLVRLRREPRRRLAGDRRRRRHRARPPPAWARRPSAPCAPPGAAARTSCRPPSACTRSSAPWAIPSFYVTALLARWHAPTATLAWINCGHPPAYVVDGEAPSPSSRALSTRRSAPATSRRLRGRRGQPRARRPPRALITDGVTERFVKGGGRFGVDGLQRAVRAAGASTAAATAMAIQDAVMGAATDPLQDDATLVVLAVD